jgi:prepilin-type N-terminal cleavage/methylation domain-containing protein
MRTRRILGFTMIEMMTVLVVVVVLLLVAMPSFWTFRQRAATRAGAEQAASFWNQARFEAVKRNSYVKVGYVTSGSTYCMGAAVTTDPTDRVACDCTTAGACDIARWPEDQGEWNQVSISGTPTLGPSGANAGVTVVEPKRTALADSTDEGVVAFAGPPGGKSYKLNLLVDRFGRAKVCESSGATDKMSDFTDRRCDP